MGVVGVRLLSGRPAPHREGGRIRFETEDLLENFGRIWPVHVREFAELLIALRRQFDGDLDLMLVLAVIGSRTLPSRRVDGLSNHDFAEGTTHDSRPDPINLQSLADCTGIPRETVRRKLRRLETAGWVERRQGCYVIAPDKARSDLSAATEATLRYLVAIGSACMDAATRK